MAHDGLSCKLAHGILTVSDAHPTQSAHMLINNFISKMTSKLGKSTQVYLTEFDESKRKTERAVFEDT